jgi:hypothetical protein
MEQKTKLIIIILAGSTMIAHGLRMMVQGLFYPTSIYPAPVPTSIDFWFDWFTLAVMGSIVFFIGLTSFYRHIKTQTEKEIMVFQPT